MFEEDDSKFAIAALESITCAFTFVMPSVMGLLWNRMGSKVFMISLITIVFSVVLTAFLLPSTSIAGKK